jgi:hypothetical protein
MLQILVNGDRLLQNNDLTNHRYRDNPRICSFIIGRVKRIAQPIYRSFSPIGVMTSLKECIRMVFANFNMVLEKRKLAFEIVGIGEESVSHLHRPNGCNYIDKKGRYYQYLGEAQR